VTRSRRAAPQSAPWPVTVGQCGVGGVGERHGTRDSKDTNSGPWRVPWRVPKPSSSGGGATGAPARGAGQLGPAAQKVLKGPGGNLTVHASAMSARFRPCHANPPRPLQVPARAEAGTFATGGGDWAEAGAEAEAEAEAEAGAEAEAEADEAEAEAAGGACNAGRAGREAGGCRQRRRRASQAPPRRRFLVRGQALHKPSESSEFQGRPGPAHARRGTPPRERRAAAGKAASGIPGGPSPHWAWRLPAMATKGSNSKDRVPSSHSHGRRRGVGRTLEDEPGARGPGARGPGPGARGPARPGRRPGQDRGCRGTAAAAPALVLRPTEWGSRSARAQGAGWRGPRCPSESASRTGGARATGAAGPARG
jgi:hypothetical protein